MPKTLFHYHLNIALENASEKLRDNCSKAPGSPSQKSFDQTIQMPLMTKIQEYIQSLSFDESTTIKLKTKANKKTRASKKIVMISEESKENPEELLDRKAPTVQDWQEFKSEIEDYLKDVEIYSAKEQINKQGKSPGENISTELLKNYCLTTLEIFDKLQKQMSDKLFKEHANQNNEDYTTKKYTSSPLLHQLINIALTYKFNKIQQAMVNNDVKYSSIHDKKWGKVTSVISEWTKLQNSNIVPEKSTVASMLKELVSSEQDIHSRTGDTAPGYVRGLFFKAFHAVEEYLNPNELRLGTELTAFLERFNTSPEHAVLPPTEEIDSTDKLSLSY